MAIEQCLVNLGRHRRVGDFPGGKMPALYGRPGGPPLLFNQALRDFVIRDPGLRSSDSLQPGLSHDGLSVLINSMRPGTGRAPPDLETRRIGDRRSYTSLRGNKGAGSPIVWPAFKPPQVAAENLSGEPGKPSCA